MNHHIGLDVRLSAGNLARSSRNSNKKQLPHFKEKPAFDSAAQGWFYDECRNIIWAKLKGGANKAFSLTFYSDASAKAGSCPPEAEQSS